MPESTRIKQPEALIDAQKFVGTKIERWWGIVEGVAWNDWFPAEITEVSVDIVEEQPDGSFKLIDDEDGAMVLVTYPPENGEESTAEDLPWSDVFENPEINRIVSLPADAYDLVQEQNLGHVAKNTKRTQTTRAKQANKKAKIKNEPKSLGKQPSKPATKNKQPASQRANGVQRKTYHDEAGPSRPAATGKRRRLSSPEESLENGNSDEDDEYEKPGGYQYANGNGIIASRPSLNRRVPSEYPNNGAGPSQPARGRKPAAHATALPKFNLSAFRMPTAAVEGLAGQLYSVRLMNFMCHENLEIKFLPHVNVITGPNGSGKSAILQALQCCLGVKATQTGRFRALREFIKHGEHHARVQVTVWNTGRDAYMAEYFGPQITIERRFTPKTSVVEIKDALGNKRLTGKEELNKCLEGLSINASNPAVVLTQDQARCFAGDRGDNEKYDIFVQATHFDITIQNLTKSNHHIAEHEAVLEEHEKHVAKVVARINELKQQLEQLREIDNWRRDITTLTQTLAWQIVYDLEANIQRLERSVEDEGPNRVRTARLQLDDHVKHVQHIEAQLKKEHKELDEMNPRIAGCAAEIDAIKNQMKGKKNELKTLRRDAQNLENDIESKEQEKESLREGADEAEAEILQATQGAVDLYKSQVEAARFASHKATAEWSEAQKEKKEAESLLAKAKMALSSAKGIERKANERVTNAQQRLNSYRQSRGNSTSLFGGVQAVRLKEAVERAVRQNKFHKAPIGPIGSYLSLTDDIWGVAVEASIGRQFFTWIVHDRHDQQLLKSLAGRDVTFSTIVYDFDTAPYNLPRSNLPSDTTTILDVLAFPSDAQQALVLRNVLIDNNRVESTLLVRDDAKARSVLRNDRFWQAHKITGCWSRQATQVLRRGKTELVLPSNRRYYAKLVRDPSTLIADATQDHREAQAAQIEASQKVQQAQREVDQAQSRVNRAHRAVSEKRVNLQESQVQLEDVQTQAPVELELATDQGSATRIVELETQIAQNKAELDGKHQEIQELKQDLENAARRLQEAKNAPTELAKRVEEIKSNIHRISEALEEKQKQKAAAEQLLEQLNTLLAGQKVQLDEHREAHPKFVLEASVVCTREVEAVGRQELIARWEEEGRNMAEQFTTDRLNSKIENLQRRIDRRERDAGITLDDVRDELATVEGEYTSANALKNEIAELLSVLKDSYNQRRRKLRELKHTVAENVNRRFNSYMSRRGHSGNILVDWQSKRLIMEVTINKGKATKDLKTLSGGERSITTIAFILALAQEASSPAFQVLDEFDIFTDAVNRRSSLTYLMEFAATYADRQLILLTPQDTGAIADAKKHLQEHEKRDLDSIKGFLNVVRMNPPRQVGQQQQQQQQAQFLCLCGMNVP